MINETLEAQNTPPRRKSSDRIQTVTSGTFPSLVLEEKGPIAVGFMSYGCAQCRAMEPVLQQVAEMVRPKENIFRVNIPVEQELIRQLPDPGHADLCHVSERKLDESRDHTRQYRVC